jgi:glycerophosphoryl diester phosphodiesterase
MAFEIQAHRGARAFFPENTVQAFCHAAQLGIRVVELDLVVSSDHQILVSHDPWIAAPLCADAQGEPLPTSDKSRIIYHLPYADIARFDCGLPHPSFPQQARIRACKPLLATVFREVDAFMADAGLEGAMLYNLEIKSWQQQDGILHPAPERYAALVVQLVEEAGFAARVRIQSFDVRVVREAWRLNPQLCYGLLVDRVEHGVKKTAEQMQCSLEILGFSPAYVNPHYSLVDRALVEWLHEQQIKLTPWTVNAPEEMRFMQQIGADGIITDHPELALALFSGNALPVSAFPKER